MTLHTPSVPIYDIIIDNAVTIYQFNHLNGCPVNCIHCVIYSCPQTNIRHQNGGIGLSGAQYCFSVDIRTLEMEPILLSDAFQWAESAI